MANVKTVVMGIKANADGIVRRITVDFDLSNLTPEQIAEWAVSANGIRVWYQNRVRPKGDAYLVELSKTTQKVVVPPCGTRSSMVQTLTPRQMVEALYNAGKIDDDMYAMMLEKIDE